MALEYRLATSLLLVLWVSGISSAIIDNIPFTTMMIPVITNLGKNPDVQVNYLSEQSPPELSSLTKQVAMKLLTLLKGK